MAEKISEKLRSALPSLVDLHIEDRSGGCGQSFLVIVVADADFRDIKLLERQQKVNAILAEEIASVHAFELKTWLPEVWATKKAEYIK